MWMNNQLSELFKKHAPSHLGPWILSMGARLEMLRARSQRVAFLAEGPNSSSFRYRCSTIANALNLMDCDVSASWFYREESDVLTKLITELSTLVISRFRWTPELEALVSLAQSRGVRVVFDCDDFVFDPDAVPMIVSSLDALPQDQVASEVVLDHWFSHISRLHRSGALTDVSSMSTALLSEQAERVFSHPSFVIRNVVDDIQERLSLQLKYERLKRSNEIITFGYFSGSPSHNRDFALVADALGAIMEDDYRVRLVLVGFLDLPEWFAMKFERRIKRYELMNYLNLLEVIASVDFNLAPLQTNLFTACKSELKFFDAAFLGVPTIATRHGSIKETLGDSEAAMLTENDNWLTALGEACSMPLAQREALGERAFDFARSNFTMRNIQEAAMTTLVPHH